MDFLVSKKRVLSFHSAAGALRTSRCIIFIQGTFLFVQILRPVSL